MKQTTLILDKRAREITRKYLLTEGELLECLSQMKQQHCFLELGYSGLFDYGVKALGLSHAQAYYFKAVLGASETVPELKAAVVEGQLSLSQARRIAPVVTTENKTEWIEKAKVLSQVKLEQAVTAVNPNAKPKEKIRPLTPELHQMAVSLDNQTKEDLDVLLALLSSKLKRPATLGDVLKWIAKEARDKHDPVRKAQRSISSGNPKVPVPGRQLIPAGVRHDVIRKHGAQCGYVFNGQRFGQTRWLHLHHKQEVARGGLNTPDNLIPLCAGHHRLTHGGAFPNQKK